jgi:DnaD/phage-associated family protein
VEALEAYIAEKEASLGGVEWEFRRLLGIYGRSLSPSERAYFKKWSEEYDYSVTVVGEAFDIAVLNTKDGKADLRYMDSVLTDWHTAGCRTVTECRARCEAKRLEVKQTEPKKKSKTVAQAPRYGNFDVQDAFEKALERSYGEND